MKYDVGPTKYWNLNNLYGRSFWNIGKREVNRICRMRSKYAKKNKA